MATISNVRTVYQEAAGLWTGCNWPARFGCLGLELEDVPALRAHRAARRWRRIAAGQVAYEDITAAEEAALVNVALHLWRRDDLACLVGEPECRLEVCAAPARCFCADVLASEWDYAGDWLEEIEADAGCAEEEGRAALAAAEAGDWEGAWGHAHQARLLESGYLRVRAWAALERALEPAVR